MVETENPIIESSDINELEELFAKKTGQAPKKIVLSSTQPIEKTQQNIPYKPPVIPQQTTQPKTQTVVQSQPTFQPQAKQDFVMPPLTTDQPLPPPPEWNKPDEPMRLSLDDFIAKDAEAKKQAYIKQTYERLFSAITNQPNQLVAPSVPVQQPIIEQVQPEPVVVKDNSEAIAAIDAQIADDSVRDKIPLIRIKRQLQGQPFTREDEVMFSNNSSGKRSKKDKEDDSLRPDYYEEEQPKKKVGGSGEKVERTYSKKVGAALGALVFTISFMVFYGAVAAGWIH